MRCLIFLLLFLAFTESTLCQDSIQHKNKHDFGIEGSVTTGFGYTYSLGGAFLLEKKHAVGLGISALLPENPFKEKWNRGAYLDYNFFFKRINSRPITAYICIAFHYLNIKTQWRDHFKSGTFYHDNRRNSIFNLIGLGANFKMSNNLFLKSCVSIYTAGYERLNIDTGYSNMTLVSRFDYNTFSYFSIEGLNLRCTLKYYFK